MKTLFILIFIGINLNLSSVRGDFFDITTAYKFNVEEESDVNGDTITTYLDTCQLVVHVQNNAVGLPYLNVKNTSSNQIIYPVKAPSIPDETQWKTLNADGTLKSLSNAPLLEYIEFFNYVKNPSFFSLFVNHKFSVLYETEGTKEQKYEYSYALRSRHYQDYYKYNFDLSKFNVLSDNFLFLENKKENIKDIKFSLKHQNDEYYQSVVVSIGNYEKKIEICNERSTSTNTCTRYAYADDAENQISILMTLKDDLRIYDLIGRKVFTFPFKGPYIRIQQPSIISYSTPITYKIVQVPQKVMSSEQTITTPSFHDIRNSTNLLIVHYTKSAGNITAQLKEQNTENVIQLKKEQIVMKSGKNDNPNNLNELVLTKFKVRFPHNWNNNKQIQITADKGVYIVKMWEGGDLEKYRIHENKTCAKNTIGEIYDVAIKEPRQGKQITTCLNGGFPDQYKETCVCPPGFTGDSCELACGRNSYGHECSNLCSATDTECKGIILCTPSYGCSCAPGYYGDKCLQQCEEGRYGADCKQSCGQCKHGCDKYTGHCIGECVNAYLVRPTCREYHSYWKGSPNFVNSSFNSVRLSLNFELNNIVQSSVETQFFMVQYKENVETYWNNCSYETFRPNVTEYEVENLKPGRKYLFRVILIAQSLKTHNPELCQIWSFILARFISGIATHKSHLINPKYIAIKVATCFSYPI
uniref:Tyrosine-protein kinase receptor Tie-1 n=1 Tax=Cacopsylla melanoneura TaxID=428564 RepID=A0A8D8YJH1_9HEMI